MGEVGLFNQLLHSPADLTDQAKWGSGSEGTSPELNCLDSEFAFVFLEPGRNERVKFTQVKNRAHPANRELGLLPVQIYSRFL